MRQMLSRAVLIVLCAVPLACRCAEGSLSIEISAGEWDREQSLVSFTSTHGSAKQLIDSQGNHLPLQWRGSEASFVLPRLPKGAVASFRLLDDPLTDSTNASIEAVKSGNKLKISKGGKTILEYQAEPGEFPRPDVKPLYKRGGYLHPVFSPSGKLITDDFPSNHIHHHGIWFPWTKTEFEGRHPDFWNMGDGKGRVEFVSLDGRWSGSVYGGFLARHRFVDLTAAEPKTALNETWEVKVYNVSIPTKPCWVFDLVSTQECATSSPLLLPKYYYGGLGFRGNWLWNGKENTSFLTSDGETDRIKGNETRGRWCYIGGKVDGQPAGLAILCHPSNFRAPQPMRLHPSEPFFCFAPSQLGDWEISPGKPYISHYRFVVFDGEPDRAALDRLWNDYAHPVEVTLK